MRQRPLAVFDLDGVLADVTHRVHLIEKNPKDWDGFFGAAVRDPLYAQGAELVKAAVKECKVLYLTGRPERCRGDTVRWLARHGLPMGDLLMRPDRDRQPARRFKPKALQKHAKGREVAFIVDDDPEVCDAYEKAGFTVLRATWALPSTVLTEAQEKDGKT